MSVYQRLRSFVQAHRRCGIPCSNIEPSTAAGFLLWIDCPCGASFERLVPSRNEDEDLLRSALLAFEH